MEHEKHMPDNVREGMKRDAGNKDGNEALMEAVSAMDQETLPVFHNRVCPPPAKEKKKCTETDYAYCGNRVYNSTRKPTDDKRDACLIHKDAETQNFRKNTVSGYSKQEIETMQGGRIK